MQLFRMKTCCILCIIYLEKLETQIGQLVHRSRTAGRSVAMVRKTEVQTWLDGLMTNMRCSG